MTFKLIDTQELNDIKSQGEVYEHLETGAKVLFIENNDPNKAFTIAFKTPPASDNGIAHIIEHAVLNGSKKYPSKEPFVELIKGSLSTFVNAMTYPDKTIYPVASTNQQDFQNLMSVYLDAVFNPNLLEDSQILAQEGWHYHLETAEDDLIFKGVVYNEMKGASASPEQQLFNHMKRELYPGTLYAYESGGLPSAIPSLTQSEFIDFHNTYYHPSNSLTILYGDFNQEVALNMLAEYFDIKERLTETVDLKFEANSPDKVDFSSTYSVTEGDETTDKDYLALAWHVSNASDTIDNFGLSILGDILFGNNQAPLKKALLDAEIGGDISGDFMEIGYPNVFAIIAKYSQVEKLDQFKTVVKSTLEDLVEKGIAKDLIEAAVNSAAFSLREAAISESEPRGVNNAIDVLFSWMYEESPFSPLDFSEKVNKMHELAKGDYFEKLIERKLLNNDHKISISLTAEPGKSDRLEAETLEELNDFKKSLSVEEIDALVANTQALITRQESPDNPEDLAKIPTLTREDLHAEVDLKNVEVSPFNEGTNFYHADEFTSGIDYVNLYFDISDFTEEEFTTLSYLNHLMGDLDTENYTLADLNTQIDIHTGGLNGSISLFENYDKTIRPFFSIRGKALEDSSAKLIELMAEIIKHTKYDDQEAIIKVTQSLISSFEGQINYRANGLAANRALSQVKAVYKLSERTKGIDYFNFLKEARKVLKEEQAEDLMASLKSVLEKLLNLQRLNVLYIGSKDRVETVKNTIQTAFADMNQADLGSKVDYQAGKKQNEAFVTAQDVNYVASATDVSDQLEFNGTTNVITTFLRYDYLWNTVRVQGGAYGASHKNGRFGDFVFSSYRDPNIGKTLNTYDAIPNYLDSLEVSESELTRNVIGTMSNLDRPLSAYDKGTTAFAMEQSGITITDLERLKQEVIETSMSQIKEVAQNYRRAFDDNRTVVIGNKTQIEAEKELFDAVYDLF